MFEFITNESALIRKISTKNTTQQYESFNAELGRAMLKLSQIIIIKRVFVHL